MPIVVEKLNYAYMQGSAITKAALTDISLRIEDGEFLGLIGHTGSGKSTFVQQLNGLLQPNSGTVHVDGFDMADKKQRMEGRKLVGMVFQYPEYQLFEETVFKDVAFGPSNMGLSGDELNTRVLDTCRLVGIRDEYLEKSPFDLSGGEKRRVAIAGVMAMRPEIIVFDEPTAGLDPKGREDVMKIIFDYRLATSATVIVISHSMEDMAVLADKLLVMNKGSLFMFDTTENVFKNGDKLREIGLNVPIVTRVFYELKAAGLCVPDDVFTVERAVRVLTDMKARARNA